MERTKLNGLTYPCRLLNAMDFRKLLLRSSFSGPSCCSVATPDAQQWANANKFTAVATGQNLLLLEPTKLSSQEEEAAF